MKTLCIAVSIALSSAAAAALHAQPSPAAGDDTRVTVTGCVERSSSAETPRGETGVLSGSLPDTRFVLTNPSTGTVAGTTGTTAGTAAASNVSYRLDDADQSKVSSHHGQKVEITGTIEGQGSRESPTPGPSFYAPKLKVESIRTIAASCSK